MHNAEAVGPSQIEPSFGKTFATRYKPPFGVHIWCLNFLTSFIVQASKMVCFFEAAFENDLRFPLHPFIKSVLQHFNVCPSQLSPNFWGVLVGLLVVFRDKGLGVFVHFQKHQCQADHLGSSVLPQTLEGMLFFR